MSSDLFRAAWDTLASLIKDQVDTAATSTSSLTSTVLKVFDDVFQEGTEVKVFARSLIGDILQSLVAKCETALDIETTDDALSKSLTPLDSMLQTFGQTLFYDTDFATVRSFQVELSVFHLPVTGHGRDDQAEGISFAHCFPYFAAGISLAPKRRRTVLGAVAYAAH